MMAFARASRNAISTSLTPSGTQPQFLSKSISLSTKGEILKDEGKGFDPNNLPDPAPENIRSMHGRGIHVRKALMDEVRFEEGGVVVHMRKSAGEAPKLLARDPQQNVTN
jgi:hypothetical protein